MTEAYYRERAKTDTRKKADLLKSEDGLKKRLEESFAGNELAIDRADRAEAKVKELESAKGELKAEIARLTSRVSHLEGYLQRVADEDRPDVIAREEHADTTPTPLQRTERDYAFAPHVRHNCERPKEWYEL